MLIYIKAILLSLIQSFAEFLPVSSSAHLIVFEKYLNFDNNDGGLFEIVIQLASILAVCIFYRKKIFDILFTINKSSSQNFVLKFLVAFMPCAIIGLLFYKYIKLYLYSDLVIAISLIVGGLIFFIVDKMNIKRKFENVDDVNIPSSLKIGLYQVISMIPGVSRSGSTIVGGLLSGLSRKTAVEFSFLLAIPTILSATLMDLYKNLDQLNSNNLSVILIGFIFTFIFSTFVIKWFLNYISSHNFTIFAYYRIILGTIIVLIRYL